MASTAAFDGRARWGGAGRWQRRAWLTLAISTVASPEELSSKVQPPDWRAALDQVVEDLLGMPACTYDQHHDQIMIRSVGQNRVSTRTHAAG